MENKNYQTKGRKKYTSVWWETSEEDSIEEVLKGYTEWDIFKMFLVYNEGEEAYRIVLVKDVYTDEKDPDHISFKEGVEFLGFKTSTVYNMINKNKLPYLKRGNRILFSKKALLSWLENRTIPHTTNQTD